MSAAKHHQQALVEKILEDISQKMTPIKVSLRKLSHHHLKNCIGKKNHQSTSTKNSKQHKPKNSPNQSRTKKIIADIIQKITLVDVN